jgi:hypothetical protein
MTFGTTLVGSPASKMDANQEKFMAKMNTQPEKMEGGLSRKDGDHGFGDKSNRNRVQGGT